MAQIYADMICAIRFSLRFHRFDLCNPVRLTGQRDRRTDTPRLLHPPFWSHDSIRFSPNLFLQRMLWMVWPKMCMWCMNVICMACVSWLITAGLRLSYYCITACVSTCDAWYYHVIHSLAISGSSLVIIHGGLKHDGSKDGRRMAMEMEMEITMQRAILFHS